ncbi:hypothetical protein [Herbiconiux solani]|uniref:hypothetical protein n=1 Tax=Herbiconiux solani TaxID=661329 RepID=UPI0008263B6F|nr:hypothetical protein [Herbiconiux solani]
MDAGPTESTPGHTSRSRRSDSKPKIPGYFVGTGALVAGGVVFIGSLVALTVTNTGSYGFWGFLILIGLVIAILAAFGTALVGLIVFAIARTAPMPKSPARWSLLIGALCAALGTTIVLVFQAFTGIIAPFTLAGVAGALAAGAASGASAWKNRPGRPPLPDNELLERRTPF